MSVAAVGGRPSLELNLHEATPDSAQSVPAAIEALSLLTTGRNPLAKPQLALQ
jgi:hypothetical protein